MTRLLISTTMRKANPGNPSGFLYTYDLENGQIIQRTQNIESPYLYVDPNPRGGLRGAKGITCNEDLILISNSHSIFVFDRNWILQRIISHPSCAGIHDILLDEEDNLWVTSTRNDMLIKFNLLGELLQFIYLRENDDLQRELNWYRKPLFSLDDVINGKKDFRDPRTHALTKYDSLHLNSICQLGESGFLISLGLVVGQQFSSLMRIKEVLVNANFWPWVVSINQAIIKLFRMKKDIHSNLAFQPASGKSVVLRIKPTGELNPCLILEHQHVPSHSVAVSLDGTAFYLNSSTGNLLHFQIEDAQILSTIHVTDEFLRGALIISDQEILVGAQNSLVLINYQEKRIVKHIILSEEANEAVFAINVLPESFSLPPESLSKEYNRYQEVHGNHLAL